MQSSRSVVATVVVCLGVIVATLYSLKRGREGETGRTSILQDRSNNCGPAALQMILKHHGVDVSIRRLEQESKTSSKGASMQGLKDACELHGLPARAWRLQWEDLSGANLPVIAFLRGGHFVVVDSLEPTGFVRIRDPLIGLMKISKEEFAERWGGEVITFGLHRETWPDTKAH